MPPDTHTPPNWQPRVICALGGDPQYAEGVKVLTAQANVEGGNSQWNPLNTTFRLLGSTPYNHVGVQNYSHPYIGICATVLTFDNGYYRGIVGALQGGTLTALEIAEQNSHEYDVWGTGGAAVIAEVKRLDSAA